MPEDISLSCACGQFQAVIEDASDRTGNHGLCYCVDCQAFARHLGQEARVMTQEGGTEIYQTQPAQISIVAGQEHLALLRLSPKGLNRWYAACCATPICNTPGSAKISFAGVLVGNMNPPLEALGPVRFRYKMDQATAPVDGAPGSLIGFILKTLRNVARARLSGSWRDTPFFDTDSGRSVVKPYVLTDAERSAAYAAK